MVAEGLEPIEEFPGILAFIPADSDFTMDETVARLRKSFPNGEVTQPQTGDIRILSDNWVLLLVLMDDVIEESREMGEWMAEHPRSGEIAKCNKRIEFVGSDLEGECFQGFLIACEVLNSFHGVFVFDLENKKEVG